MAKKKKAAPQKKCVGCGRSIAAATKTCKHCGAINTSKKKKTVRKKPAATKAGRPASAAADSLDAAIKFVEQSGGLRAAKAAIDKIERIKSL